MSEGQTPMTPREFLLEEYADHWKKMVPSRKDGLIIAALKITLHTRIWNWAYLFAVRAILKAIGRLDKPTANAELWVRHAADTYMLFGGIAVLLCYSGLLEVARTANANSPPCLLVILLCVIPLFRLAEAFSVVVMLHASGQYRPPAPMRAVSRIIWTYLE